MSLKWGQKLEDALFMLYNVSWEVFAAIYQNKEYQQTLFKHSNILTNRLYNAHAQN